MTTIESQDLTIEKLFNDFYVIPSYQREYVWGEEEVREFVEDIYNEFSANTFESVYEYFIGSIIVCARPDSLYEVIDGQQRMTTAYLLLCAIRDRVLSINPSERIEALKSQIASLYIDENGNDKFRHRVEVQYEESRGVLERIALQEDLADIPHTRSVENIKNAYQQILSFISKEFGADKISIPQIKRFYAYLMKNVTLIRVKTASVTHAMRIYATLNHRGLRLDEIDLLKNLMFAKVKQSEYDRINAKWKEMVDILFHVQEKSTVFLRYFILAHYEADENKVRENQIYDWFIKNEEKCSYDTHPIAFVNNLIENAKAYVGFLEGKNKDGTIDRYLVNIRCLSNAARKHLILLLAAKHLPIDAFTELCRQIENLLFVSAMTSDRHKGIDGVFAKWATELRQIKDIIELHNFIRDRIQPLKQKAASRFESTFRKLSESSLQNYQVKYILAKLTQYIDESAWGSSGGIDDLTNYIRLLDIEHILPTVALEELRESFDKPNEIETYSKRLGNLTLLERTLSAAAIDKPFAAKKKIYSQSKFLLTKTIGEKVNIVENTAVDRAAQELKSFDDWNSSAIEIRQKMLTQLAMKVWDMVENG